MTGEELDAIRQRLAAATPGRWIWWMSEEPPFAIGAEPHSHHQIASALTGTDADFICAAPADIANLLAEVEQLQRVVRNMMADAETKERMQQAQNEHMFALQDERTAAQAEVERLRARLAAVDEEQRLIFRE